MLVAAGALRKNRPANPFSLSMTKSRNLIRKRWNPDDEAIAFVMQRFSNQRTQDIADALGVGYSQVVKLAKKLGLKKSDAFLNSPAGGRTGADPQRGASTRFSKGHAPWSKGKKIPNAGLKTRFVPGQKPANHMPVGSLRVNSDGYLQIKLTDTGYPPKDWVMYHRHVWEQAHGPIPPGHLIVFRTPDRPTQPEQITPEVLECVSRQEHIRRHALHNYGPEIANLVILRGAITRQIRKRSEQKPRKNRNEHRRG